VTKDYSSLVEVRIDRFDPSSEGVLLLECTWKVQPVEGGDAPTQAFSTEVKFDGTMAGRVRAMNQALGKLAQVVAQAL
jgi:uncharacterized lipoprotein YmbA